MSYSDSSVIKGWIGRVRHGAIDGIMDFQFNPTSLDEDLAPQYTMVDPPGSPLPTAVFKSVSNDEISFRLLLDATENYSSDKQGILAQQAFLQSLARPELQSYVESFGQFVSPPDVVLTLGPRSWKSVLTECSFKTVRWNRDLVPTRCWATLTFKTILLELAWIDAEYNDTRDLRSLAERR